MGAGSQEQNEKAMPDDPKHIDDDPPPDRPDEPVGG